MAARVIGGATTRLAAYGHLVRAQVRGQAQYRASLLVDVVGSVLFGVLDVATVVVFFRVTSDLAGFAFPEVFLMTALTSCAFSLADLAVGNVERLRFYVRTGLFDAVLVRPLGTLVQLLAMDVAPRRVGRVVFGIALVAAAAVHARVPASLCHIALLAVTPLAGAVIFGSIFVATSTVTFWWIESGEFGNALTYGGHDFAAYPLTIYGAALRRLFAYGLGFAFVAYYPALSLLGRADPLGAPAILGYSSPLIALAAAGIAALFWRSGIRHYRSTGS
jgi:ABC-2 type transport system permease protein